MNTISAYIREQRFRLALVRLCRLANQLDAEGLKPLLRWETLHKGRAEKKAIDKPAVKEAINTLEDTADRAPPEEELAAKIGSDPLAWLQALDHICHLDYVPGSFAKPLKLTDIDAEFWLMPRLPQAAASARKTQFGNLEHWLSHHRVVPTRLNSGLTVDWPGLPHGSADTLSRHLCKPTLKVAIAQLHDGVDIEVDRREIVGLIGPNGAGKTTLFDLICGFTAMDRGRVVLDGRDVAGLPPHRIARLGLGRSFQDAALFSSLTVEETIAVALDRWVAVKDPISAMLRLPGSVESEDHVLRRVDELIELFDLGRFRERFIGELSTGSRRIVDLACVVAHSPSVLLLDEPSSGIAQRETEALGPLIVRLRDELGCAIVVIEHDMPLLASICDRLVALESGALVAAGPVADVLADERVVASYLGTTPEVIARSGSLTDRPPSSNGSANGSSPTGGTHE